MAFDLIIVGELNVDVIVDCGPDDIRFGQAEQLVDSATLALGSSGAITACGAARLGLRTAVVGVVGRDPLGDFVIAELDGRGVDTRWCTRRDGGRTGITVALSRRDDRAMLTDLGVTGSLTAFDVDEEAMASARHLHISSYFLQRGLWPGLANLLRGRPPGVTASLDPNWDPAEQWDSEIRDVIPLVDWFLPNDHEALRISDTTEVIDAARALALMGTTAVVTCGAEGVLLDGGGPEKPIWCPAPTVESVDTTGAGDSFTAGFLAAKLGGASDNDALELASVCGALATLKPGGIEGQPTMREARAFGPATPSA
jgi:sugar/nucleoside kinase (ribokinase family)